MSNIGKSHKTTAQLQRKYKPYQTGRASLEKNTHQTKSVSATAISQPIKPEIERAYVGIAFKKNYTAFPIQNKKRSLNAEDSQAPQTKKIKSESKESTKLKKFLIKRNKTFIETLKELYEIKTPIPKRDSNKILNAYIQILDQVEIKTKETGDNYLILETKNEIINKLNTLSTSEPAYETPQKTLKQDTQSSPDDLIYSPMSDQQVSPGSPFKHLK